MSDIIATEQTLHVSASDSYPEDYRLLELPTELAAQLEGCESASLVIRGRDTDTAILIGSDDQAYQLHTAHTSNSLYLLSQDNPHQLQLRAKLHQIFELQKTNPQIRARVLQVLESDPRGHFRGAEFESNAAGHGVTSDELLRHVQASERQMEQVLRDIPAFKHRGTGCWRIIDAGYCVELLRLILATQVEQDWQMDSLDADKVYSVLHAESSSVLFEAIEAVLCKFCLQKQPGVFSVDSQRVAQFLAEQIFATESKAWPVPEFQVALQATMPPQLPFNDMAFSDMGLWTSRQIPDTFVRSLAFATALPAHEHLLFSEQGVPAAHTLLTPVDKSTLSSDPRARLRQLFAVKNKWTARELRPFLEDLVDVDMQLLQQNDDQALSKVSKTIDAWMLKFGRGVKGPAGELIYTSRIN
ncbi:Ctf8p and Ctf18p associating protein [Coemansia sp. RSA 989]|nr:sister chromatid cohesion protein Dcc1 [Coemansia mojavensis]KAJ1743847.1 Ctf8p and Ctf18p associating protein [Coemansia sp. RSA 1086]KAJ1751597.1 Ctf8p and Ctf18p associating protein [Coemansia sp. RSA 1821]KAJ1867260.1 Ctf8p and Ctf18p associating protein [Coemansia sp. RSA 989]KAJ1876006.1 Ctf8p and Ctf18p associating protein [Coemansia sp. RSA 990]KAJ2630893.1 Ctf8p and Ctf18p associating protein [Coemansia sp. RSA 1290]KAJ2652561.1 Ctf8p and Ctf18p associating protein [Coemansia sp. 